jgi:hypothetical protein
MSEEVTSTDLAVLLIEVEQSIPAAAKDVCYNQLVPENKRIEKDF